MLQTTKRLARLSGLKPSPWNLTTSGTSNPDDDDRWGGAIPHKLNKMKVARKIKIE